MTGCGDETLGEIDTSASVPYWHVKDHVPASFLCRSHTHLLIAPNKLFWPGTRIKYSIQFNPGSLAQFDQTTGVYQPYSRLQPAHAMNIYLAWTGTILYWISWPIGIVLFYLFAAVLALLKLTYYPIAFILSPVVYLLRFIAACLALPFRALVKLEVSGPSFIYSMVRVTNCLFSAPVQLYRRCGTNRPARWIGTILHLQHLPSPPSSRLNARPCQRTDF